jgi:hypothetical protein
MNFDPQRLKPYPPCLAHRHAKSTVLEGSTKTDTHAGALSLAGGAPEPAAIDVELAPSHLTVASHHHRPLPSQGERIEIPASP